MYTSEELQNPHTSAARLATIAQHHPETYPWIIVHPNCYPSLTQWLLQVDPTLEKYLSAPIPVPNSGPAPPPPMPTQSVPVELTPAQIFADQPQGVPQQYTATNSHALPNDTQSQPTPPPSTQQRKYGKWVALISMVLVVLLAGGAYFIISGKLRGEKTPTAAAEKLLQAVVDGDMLALYGSFIPSEIDGFRTLIDDLPPIQSPDNDSTASGTQPELSQAIKNLPKAISINTEGLEFEEQVIVEGQVTRVTLTKGIITLTIDENKLVDAMLPYADIAIRTNLKTYMDPDSQAYEEEIHRHLVKVRKNILNWAEQIRNNGPIDIVIEKQRQINELGYSTTELMSVVAVNEGNDWYISPLMTGADLGFRSTSGAASWGPNEIILGHSIPEATQFSSSEEAATGLANAIANGTPRELAKVMPLPERRLLAVYGPTLTNNIERESLWEEDLLVNPPQNPEFTSSTDDGITLVSPTHVTLDYSHYWGGSASVTIDNTCIRIKEDSDQYQSCLENGPDDFGPPLNILSQLGLSFSAVAVEENGGWLMSPLQTIYYQGNTLLGNLITLNNEGRLDELGY